jgi:hypothetical protein
MVVLLTISVKFFVVLLLIKCKAKRKKKDGFLLQLLFAHIWLF